MARDQYIPFFICLTDEALVATKNAQYPNGYNVAPESGAAVEFSAPWNVTTPPAPGVNGTYSPWSQVINGNFPTDVATFTRKSGGWFGIPLLFGTTTRFYWVGRFVYNPATTPTVGGAAVTPAAIAQRRWVDGFELPDGGEGVTGLPGLVTRDAARCVDGYGLGLRGATAGKRRNLADLITG